ncbi:MAG: protein translocase subunit SecD [Candidatus Babeliaceae bacterium]|nr:protein translocase subunit SecD [Candidatus Babeliaceae bacterium]
MTVSLKKILFSSLGVWLIISLFGIYFLLNLRKNLNFGIDLVGGTYITLEVKTDALLEHEAALRGKQGKPLNDLQKQEIIKNAVHDNIEILRSRLDTSGVGEVTIAAHGDKNILIELPNVHNPEQAKAMIGKSALLEVKLVYDTAGSQEELLEKYQGKLPDDKSIVKEVRNRGYTTQPVITYHLVPKFTDLTGKLLKTAQARLSDAKSLSIAPVIAFEFKPEGAEKFYQLTKNNVGKSIALILDNEVITAPRVNEAINGSGQISGDFDMQEAKDIALMLRTGAFTAPVEIVEERHIGPSLGEVAIHQGLISCLIGMALLFLFSVFFYKLAGLFAFIVLLYNLLLILFALSYFQAALTLPGIAGIVLSIGMAIDASILIYERIKELLVEGVSLKKAVDEGFSGALTVILDANITHFIVAVVLYYLGSGPIQGFAVTMIIGIIATLLTGILLLRSIFQFYTSVLGIQKISI